MLFDEQQQKKSNKNLTEDLKRSASPQSYLNAFTSYEDKQGFFNDDNDHFGIFDYTKSQSKNPLMNIIINNDDKDEEAKDSITHLHDDNYHSFEVSEEKKPGHFRGESFGDSKPLENSLKQSELDKLKSMESIIDKMDSIDTHKLQKTESHRNLQTYLLEEIKQENAFNQHEESSDNRMKEEVIKEEDEEERDMINEQESDFVILKRLVDKFSQNHHLQQQEEPSSRYGKYKNLTKEQLINKLIQKAEDKGKLNDKIKGLQENNAALAFKLQRKTENCAAHQLQIAKYSQERSELESLKEQQREFREKYEELNSRFHILSQQYDDVKLKNKKIEQKYNDLKKTINEYEESYKSKTQKLLKEIETLKEYAQQHMQNKNLEKVNSIVKSESNAKSKTRKQSMSKQQNEEKVRGSSYAEILNYFYLSKGHYQSAKKPATSREKQEQSSTKINGSPAIKKAEQKLKSNATPNLTSMNATPRKPEVSSLQRSPTPNKSQTKSNKQISSEKTSPFTLITTQKQSNKSKNLKSAYLTDRSSQPGYFQSSRQSINQPTINKQQSQQQKVPSNSNSKSTQQQYVENIDYDYLLTENASSVILNNEEQKLTNSTKSKSKSMRQDDIEQHIQRILQTYQS